MSIRLSTKTFAAVAPYQRIEQHLRERIMAREWAVGEMLPSRRELARQYGVDLNTLQRALASILDDHLLRADGRRGTFIEAIPGPKPSEEASSDYAVRKEATSAKATGVLMGILHAGDSYHEWSRFLMRTVEREFSAAGQRSAYRRDPDACRGIHQLLEIGCEALVIDGIHGNFPIDEIIASVDGRVPVIFIASKDVNRPVAAVYYDSFDAGFQAAEFLIARGARDILYVASSVQAWAVSRFEGIVAASVAHGLPERNLRVVRPEKSLIGGGHEELGYEAALPALIERFPDALIGSNDLAALGAMRAAESLGFKAGEDYALVGFDDVPEAAEAGLTTLQPPLDEMARAAADLALRSLAGGVASQKVCFHSHLIVRSSTASLTGRQPQILR